MADINGTNDNNNLSGTAGADTINGLGGNDTIDGLGGDDTLSGGAGADIFVFQASGGNGFDTITDFDPEIDTFRIETGGLDFGPDNVWYVGPNNGDLRVVMDTNGNGQRDDGDEYVTLSGILVGTGIESGTVILGGGYYSDNFSFGDDYIDFVASTDTEPEPETPTEPTSPSDSDDTSMEMTDDDTVNGFAPADQAAFDALVVGLRVESPDYYFDFVSPGRFREFEDGETYTGRYTYERTGPNSGTTITYYDDGDQCTDNIVFESTTTGTSSYSCNDGSTGTGTWQLVDIPGDDILNGTADNDTLNGTPGADTINGRDGNDILQGLGGDDTLNGNDGDDELYGGAGADTLNGNDGDDKLYGGADADTLNGGAGFNELEGGAGADVLVGMDGASFNDYDTASYASSDAGVEVRLDEGVARGGHAEGDTLVGIEGVIGSDYDDVLVGDSGDNKLVGNAGNDVLISRGYDGSIYYEYMIGGPGADSYIGGNGRDIASYEYSEAGVEVRLYDGTAKGGEAEGDTFESIEVILGSNFDDILSGNNVSNEIYGYGGNDVIDGLGGDDILSGGTGDDKLYGGAGADTLNGGAGDDHAYYTSSSVGVLVRLHAAHAVKYGEAEGDTLTGIEHLVGSNHNDILAGDGEDNLLDGGDGDDVLYGGPAGGDDRMYGGNGDDRIFGGKGNDILTGGEGNDVLKGGPGEDTFIVDGDDMDVLYGGTEKDTFQFFPSNLGGGSIRDFNDGEDVIDLTEFTGINSMDDLDIISHGDNVRIELSGTDYLTTIILSDFGINNLDATDFLF